MGRVVVDVDVVVVRRRMMARIASSRALSPGDASQKQLGFEIPSQVGQRSGRLVGGEGFDHVVKGGSSGACVALV
jgi:hypothetical protein